MKKHLTLLLAASTISVATLSAQSVTHFSDGFQRPQYSDPSGYTNEWKGLKIDNNGNAYVLANLSANQTFNGQVYTVPTNRLARLLIKYNDAGQVQWVVNTGNVEGDKGRALLLDASGNPIVVGNIGQLTNTSSLSYRLSITKYDKTSGAVIWENIAVTGSGEVKSAAMAPTGEIYMIVRFASFEENIEWGDIHNYYILTGKRHLLIKADSVGNPKWSQVIKYDTGTELTDGDIENIAVGDSCEVYIVGASDLVANEGIFVSKIDSTGNFQWSLKTGNNYNEDKGHHILYHQGAIYLTGKVGNLPLDFGNGVSSTENIPQSFIVKLTTGGTALWMRRNENSGFSLPFRLYNLAALPNGNIAVLGNFKGENVTFCGNVISSSTHPGYPGFNIRQDDAVIYEFDTTGTLLSSFSTEDTHTKVQILAAAPDNSLWFGGTYNQALKIGSDVLPQLSGSNDYNFFIARVQPASITTAIAAFSSSQTDIAIFPNPATNTVIISNIKEESTITITDVTGKVVYCVLTSALQQTIDVSNFTQGVYIVKVVGVSGVVNSRLVVQKF